MPAPIIIGAIISAAVAGIGMAVEAGHRGEAQRIRKEVADRFGKEALAQLDQALLNEIPSSQLAGVVEDNALRDAQVRAMREFEDAYKKGGMTDSDVAALRLAQQDAAAMAGRNQKEIEASMAKRGQAGSGMSAALAAQAGQSAANATARAGAEMQASARLRALRSLESSANIGRGIRADDWRSASAKASAQDELNRYNNEVPFRRTQYNNSMAQQDYQFRMQRLTTQSNAELGHASGVEAAGVRANDAFAGFAQGVNSTGQYLDDIELQKQGLQNPNKRSGR